jgi:hypothetical protein
MEKEIIREQSQGTIQKTNKKITLIIEKAG